MSCSIVQNKVGKKQSNRSIKAEQPISDHPESNQNEGAKPAKRHCQEFLFKVGLWPNYFPSVCIKARGPKHEWFQLQQSSACFYLLKETDHSMNLFIILILCCLSCLPSLSLLINKTKRPPLLNLYLCLQDPKKKKKV